MSKRLFGGKFDFNRDGKLDSFEKAAEVAFLNSMFEEDENECDSEEDADF